MPEIKKVTQGSNPDAPLLPCLPIGCVPAVICAPNEAPICIPDKTCAPNLVPLFRRVSGAYRSPDPAATGSILELRVDVDGRRPQSRVSGDLFRHYHFQWFGHTFQFTHYTASFVAESLAVSTVSNEMVITGPVKYYSDPANVSDTIEVRIPRVTVFAAAAPATVKFYTSGVLKSTFLCSKLSDSFRTVTLEIDCYLNTAFPPSADTGVDPHPAGLSHETMTTALAFSRAGIAMTVTEDEVLNDPDGVDSGTDWDTGELHDLMETRFDLFANTLQWNHWGVVVPRLEGGYYGIMFDWGGGQPGDTYFRQGAAVGRDDILSRVSGTLYNTAAKQDRLFLWTFIHEVGHAFNLPHTWARSVNPDPASESFMNYPWGYTDGESNFWASFRWEFDDVELIWMRHADRNDVIFGGRDWIGNNLSQYVFPEIETHGAPLELEVRTRGLYELGEPMRVELKLKNISTQPLPIQPHLQPEDGLTTFYLQRPGGAFVRYVPPVLRVRAPDLVELAPGQSLYETALLSYGAKGFQFEQPGEYLLRAYVEMPGLGIMVSKAARLRVMAPTQRSTEELAHLLFSREAAKLLYFGRTNRNPRLISELNEAVRRYAKSDPALVRHLHAALGANQQRRFKYVAPKEGKRVVVSRAPDLKLATMHLDAALEPLPGREVVAFDNITFNRLSTLLAEGHVQLGNRAEAEKQLRKSLAYLEKQGATEAVLKDYRERIARLPAP